MSLIYLKVGMAFKGLPVLFVVAIGVPHSMGIFALDQGACLCGIIGPSLDLHDNRLVSTMLLRSRPAGMNASLGGVPHQGYARIHGAQDVGGGSLGAASLIVHRSGRVPGPYVPCHGQVSCTRAE